MREDGTAPRRVACQNREDSFMTVEEVAEELRVSKSKAYEIVRQLNAELKQKGYLTVAGRVNTRFFQKKTCYSE